MSRRIQTVAVAFMAALLCSQKLHAAPVLSFNPSSVALSGDTGGTAVTMKVALQNTGNLATNWTISPDTSATWLTSTPLTGTNLAAGGSVNITLTANPGNLKPGTYKGALTVSGTSTVASLVVTFTVSGTSIIVTPSPITIAVMAGTQQSFPSAAQIGGNATVSITPSSSGNWLTSDTSANTPASFSISVNAKALKASSTPYQGTLLIQCPTGAPCIAQMVTVKLTVFSQPLTMSCNPTAGPTQVGVPYSTTCTASGGASPYTWSISSSTLPNGLTLSSTTGATVKISGTPKTAGSYLYVLQVADTTGQTAQQSFGASIGGAITITPNPITISALAGSQQPFSKVAQISGNAIITLSVVSGTWLTSDSNVQAPAFFSINVDARTLTASSTPYQGSVQVQCNNCAPQTVPVNLTVYSQLKMNCSPAAGPTQVGVSYSTTCAVSGGLAPFSWNIGSGTIPAGLSFSAATGNNITLSGTPNAPGSASFAIKVTDSSPTAQSVSQSFSSTIAASPATLSVSPSTLSFGSYATGGAVPATQTIFVNSMNPASGLAFTASGGSDCTWLTLSARSGSTPANLSASTDAANTTPGNHSCVMTFNAIGVSPSPTVTATLDVNSTAPTLSSSVVNLSFGSFTPGGSPPASQNLMLTSTNPSSGLAYTSSVNSDCGWLTLSPATGSTPASITASVNTANVPPGFHSCTISFAAAGVSQGPSVTATLSIGSANSPTISAVVNDATFGKGAPIATGSWVAVFGTNLAPAGDSRGWNSSTEIINGVLPTSLDGTSVSVNGKSAAIAFVSPGQINIQPPDDNAVGPVQVVVTTKAGGSSAPFTVNYAQFSPGFFAATAPYLAAQHANNSYVGGFAGATPAAPDEVIILWGTGFGAADPVVPSGKVFVGGNNLTNNVTVTIGGQTANVKFVGVVGAGLVQINVQVPSSIGNGDAAVVATIGGVSTQTTANMISIHN